MKSSKYTGKKTSPSAKGKNSRRTSQRKQALSPRPKPVLNRTTFRTSREMDFFSEKELVTQTGHEIGEWPLVFLKETIDNALDVCEDADVSPEIWASANANGIAVRDNGPGLPEATLKSALDFTIRASNREAYVSPCRGAQGNALKTLLPMPRVIDPQHGKLIIRAASTEHVICCGADPISQRAVIHDDTTELPKCKNSSTPCNDKASFKSGTEIRLEWSPRNEDGDVVWPFDELLPVEDARCSARFLGMVEGFAVFNPHATFHLDWFGDKRSWQATDFAWDKWRPNRPTSVHWYETAHLERLIAAYITHDRDAGTDRLISDVVAESDGLTGSQKRSKVLDAADMRRVKLSELIVDGHLDGSRIARLLKTMQEQTRSVKSKRLGIIGEDHLRCRLLGMGIEEESFNYSRKLAKEGLPWVLESAFGYLGNVDRSRLIYSGANWSAAINNPFRTFGDTGEGLESALADMRAGRHEPIVFVLHLAHPRVEYTDRGKSALIIGGSN